MSSWYCTNNKLFDNIDIFKTRIEGELKFCVRYNKGNNNFSKNINPYTGLEKKSYKNKNSYPYWSVIYKSKRIPQDNIVLNRLIQDSLYEYYPSIIFQTNKVKITGNIKNVKYLRSDDKYLHRNKNYYLIYTVEVNSINPTKSHLKNKSQNIDYLAELYPMSLTESKEAGKKVVEMEYPRNKILNNILKKRSIGDTKIATIKGVKIRVKSKLLSKNKFVYGVCNAINGRFYRCSRSEYMKGIIVANNRQIPCTVFPLSKGNPNIKCHFDKGT